MLISIVCSLQALAKFTFRVEFCLGAKPKYTGDAEMGLRSRGHANIFSYIKKLDKEIP